MRILCCLNRDLASSIALNLLLLSLERHDVRVALTEGVIGRHQPADDPPGRRELRVAEQAFPNEVLFPLVERAGLPDGNGRYLTFAEVQRYRDIPVFALPNPNTGEGLDVVRRFAPDLILTIRYGAILKPSVIEIPRFGVVNLHSGLLPAYRGILATFRALLAGDAEIGCTLHRIVDAGIDTGDVIDAARVPVVPERSLLWHVLALYVPGVRLIETLLARLEEGAPIPTTPQAATGVGYYSYPTAAEWGEFARRGWVVASAGNLDVVARRYMADGLRNAATR